MKKFLIVAFSIVLSLYSSDLFIQKGHYGITYDCVSLPANEKLGLLGSSYSYDFKNYYLGLGVYSAVSGQRGGFFTGGLEAGYKLNIMQNMSLDTGIFVGGGGGGSAPQGGGLMLRPHAGFLYSRGSYEIGIGYSNVKFPNGDIDSSQIYAQVNIPFETIHKKNTDSPMIIDDLSDFMNISGKHIGWSKLYFVITLQKYLISNGVKDTSGKVVDKDMSLVGLEYGRYFKNNFFVYVETAGAGGGSADGYAEFLGGVGYRLPVFKNIETRAKVSLGAAGGGKVNTGGGVIHKESIGLHSALNKKLSLSAELGHIEAVDGAFKATDIKLGFSYSFNSLSVGDNLAPLKSYESFGDYEWDIKLSNQRYLGNANIRKDSADKGAVNLIGFEIDKLLNKNFYFLGGALGAYSGKSGGYAVGLMGLGSIRYITSKFNLFSKLMIGVGGGGGVATGGGLIVQPMVGIGYKFSNTFGLQTSFGKVKAINGDLDTFVFDFGFLYKFRTIN